MIISFYDKDFKGLQNNASLNVDDKSYKLVKRANDFDSLTCISEAFTENIQPTFLIVKDNRGRYEYAALAGIPYLNENNKTEITASDLKTILNSDIFIESVQTYFTVNDYIEYLFYRLSMDVDIGFTIELQQNYGVIQMGDLIPSTKGVINMWTELKLGLIYYNLHIESELDLINKKVIFKIENSMQETKNISLWKYGIKDYTKWITNFSVAQCYVQTTNQIKYGIRWILNSQNQITTNIALQDIFPAKKRIILKETDSHELPVHNQLLNEGNMEALELLVGNMFGENISLPVSNEIFTFKNKCDIYVERGQAKYKSLPVGALHYNVGGLYKVEIGYKFTGLEFIE